MPHGPSYRAYPRLYRSFRKKRHCGMSAIARISGVPNASRPGFVQRALDQVAGQAVVQFVCESQGHFEVLDRLLRFP